MPNAIGVDLGTSNVKVALVREDGSVLGSSSRPIATSRSGEVAEQDADQVWNALCDAISEVTNAEPSAAADVVTIGVCSQYSSIVPVDERCRPVAPMAIWQDKRGTDHSWELLGAQDDNFMLWVERHGIPPVGNGLSLAHLLHFERDRPEVHQATATYLEPMDYVNARLTGRRCATQVTMLTALLCDNRTLGSTSYDDELLTRSGIDPTKLPELIELDANVGEMLPAVAEELGLPTGVTVRAGMNDTVADVIATAALREGRAGLAIGTTSVLVDTVDRHDVDLDHEVLAMPSPFGTHLVWAENGIGGRALEFVLDHLLCAADELGDHQSDDAFAAFDTILESVPVGSNGVLFLPWLNGSLSPSAEPSMRGAFLNLSLDTNRTDLVRAAAEGVAHNLAWLLPFVEAFTRHDVEELVFVGGAARSAAWGQIIADAINRPVSPVVDPDRAIARATALHALVGVGALEADDLDELVVTARTYEPDPMRHETLAPITEAFVAAFSALLPIQQALNP